MKKKSVFIIFFIFLLINMAITVNAVNTQKNLANKVIRLHIIANSDSKVDQEIKLKVRDEIIKELSPMLVKATNIGESREIIFSNISNIEKIANDTLKKYCDYTASATLTQSNFPTKNYNNISFPAGEYEALKVTIGKGKGKNWWCVMFPPLCFTNSSISFSDESIETLKQTLSNEEFELISSKTPKVKVKFKILELFNK